MIFPEQKNKASGWSGWYNRGVELITRSGPDHPRFNVPQPYKMRLQCMKMYLEQYKTVLLQGQFESKFDISKAEEIISDVYQCSARQYCGTSGSNVNHWDFSYQLNNVSATVTMRLTDMVAKIIYIHRRLRGG